MKELESEELESIVINALRRMSAKYALLDDLTQVMLDKHEKGQPIESEIEQMHRERELLTEMEQQSQPHNEAYRKTRKHASPAVQELTQQTTVLIQNVIARIAKLEDAARESFQQLIPEIDRNVRGNQMKQAYGNSSP